MATAQQKFGKLSDQEWTQLLLRSINEREIDGVKFPSFPQAAVQAQFVGSSNEDALREASQFYSVVKGYAAALGMPINQNSVFLDFGCGWGRFLRFFWRDVKSSNLIGVDIDPDILASCRQMGIKAKLSRIDPRGRIDLPDNSVSHIIAYSVFTHLPEDVHNHWIAELSRIAKPGCVFVCTTEPRRFLNFIAEIPEEAPSEWHRGLRLAAGDIESKLRSFDAGEFVYIPTGGGDYRDSSVYGDAVIPKSYIERNWTKHFALREYIEHGFWQAVVILQKP